MMNAIRDYFPLLLVFVAAGTDMVAQVPAVAAKPQQPSYPSVYQPVYQEELISQLIDARCRQRAWQPQRASFSRGMSFCLYASRSGANKKSPVSVDWHYMTLRNHCQKAS
ncbi:hypothetical protein EYF80_009026 [Liparis tanakae]|uniref:Uncharacterized protein n=1 Tax=Liparis tanakae TaxID=230148 RepID=A0A4Z2IU01_9TELE|nr:hypothetical protein EYF80_009026 [Liparis tanakae]